MSPRTPGLEVAIQAVRLEALERPLVGTTGGGRSGEARADHVREVLEVLHHGGVAQRLIDQRGRPRGVDDEVLRRGGSRMGGEGDDGGGGREDAAAAHGWRSSDRCAGIGSVTGTLGPTPTFESTAELPANMFRITLCTQTRPTPVPSPDSLVV